MLIKKVIINSSPLIVLFKSKQAELLPQIFDDILVPLAVWNEITLSSKNDLPAQQLPQVNWAKRIDNIIIKSEVAGWDLGKGESEVLSLTLDKSNYTAIVDDRAAKNCLYLPELKHGNVWGVRQRVQICSCDAICIRKKTRIS
jgi:predicted nucleic acid-binding protein